MNQKADGLGENVLKRIPGCHWHPSCTYTREHHKAIAKSMANNFLHHSLLKQV